jgi:hypothetical protein
VDVHTTASLDSHGVRRILSLGRPGISSMTRLPTTLEGARRTLCWAIVVLSATNGMAWAQFAPEDFARIEWIGETAISPGGAQVAYTRLIPRRLNEPPGGPRRELWIVSTAG